MTTLTRTAERRPFETTSSPGGTSRGLGALLIIDALLSFAPVVIDRQAGCPAA